MTSPLPLIERTPDGDQYMLHGFTPVDVRERLEHLGAHTGSPSSVRCALAKISRCVTSENSKLNPYPTTRSTAKATLSLLVTIAPAMEPFTSAYSPAPSAAAPITSSVRFPSVALSEVAPVVRTDFPLR